MRCERCDAFDTPLEIRSPAELERVLGKLKTAVAAGDLKYNGFESDRAVIGQPGFDIIAAAGPYPDMILYYFDCPACRAVFELSVETYHGQGGHWKRLR